MQCSSEDHSHEVTSQDNAHPWSVDNPCLLEGYRKNYSTVKKTLMSVFVPHNELLNIWTHFLGTLLFAFLMLYIINNVDKTKMTFQQVREEFMKTDFKHPLDSIYERAKTALVDEWRDYQDSSVVPSLTSAKACHPWGSGEAHCSEAAWEKSIHGGDLKMTPLLENVTASNLYSSSQVPNILPGGLKMKPLDPNIRNLMQMSEPFAQPKTNGINFKNASTLEIYPILVSLTGVILCLSFSFIYHLFTDMNACVSAQCKKLDYAGISIQISGSSFAIFYYWFYCRPTVLFFYSSINIVLCLLVFFITLGSYIHKPENLIKKSMMFFALGIANVFPFFHFFYLAMFRPSPSDMPLNRGSICVLLTGVSYISGLFFYGSKFPERYYPKKFDIWFNSHTIWHIFVLLGAFFFYSAILITYEAREHLSCAA